MQTGARSSVSERVWRITAHWGPTVGRWCARGRTTRPRAVLWCPVAAQCLGVRRTPPKSVEMCTHVPPAELEWIQPLDADSSSYEDLLSDNSGETASHATYTFGGLPFNSARN